MLEGALTPDPLQDRRLINEFDPATGAYTLAMASNYNGVGRPAAVLVNDGEARLVRRRETIDDLLDLEA